MKQYKGYTQRQWDRTVGWGTVPDKYKLKEVKHGLDKKQNERKNDMGRSSVSGSRSDGSISNTTS